MATYPCRVTPRSMTSCAWPGSLISILVWEFGAPCHLPPLNQFDQATFPREQQILDERACRSRVRREAISHPKHKEGARNRLRRKTWEAAHVLLGVLAICVFILFSEQLLKVWGLVLLWMGFHWSRNMYPRTISNNRVFVRVNIRPNKNYSYYNDENIGTSEIICGHTCKWSKTKCVLC